MLILLFLLQIAAVSALWTQGGYYCCGNPYQGAMTPSGYPVYGMAPSASSSVAYSGPAPTYSYASFAGSPSYGMSSPGYSGYGGGYSGAGYSGYPSSGYSSGGYSSGGYGGAAYSNYGSGVGSGIDFDAIPSGQIPPGATIGAPVAIRYFNQPIPTVLDPVALRSTAPTSFMRVPIYGIQRSASVGTYSRGLTEPAPEGYVSKYSKFRQIHSVDSDISRGYQPAYSAWNPQPIQAVFRQASSGVAVTVAPAPAPVQPESAPASYNQEEVAPAAETSSYGETSAPAAAAYAPEATPAPAAYAPEATPAPAAYAPETTPAPVAYAPETARPPAVPAPLASGYKLKVKA